MGSRNLVILLTVILFLGGLSVALAVTEPPTLNATKEVTPDSFDEGDTVTITFNLTGTGTPVGVRNNLDVMLLLDKSGSMSGSKIADAKVASKNFIDFLDVSYDNVGLVGFSHSSWDSDAYLYENLTTDYSQVKDTIDNIDQIGYGWPLGSTNTGDAINKGNAELSSPTNVKVEILLSDGVPTMPFGSGTVDDPEDYAFAIGHAQTAADNNIVIYTISLGGDANQAFMQQIADMTGGTHYYAPSSSDLNAIFTEIAGEVQNLAASSVVITDVLPVGVEVDESTLPAGCSYDSGTRTVTCAIGLVEIGDDSDYAFDVTVTDSDLTQINVSSVIFYNDYQGASDLIVINPQPAVTVGNVAPVIDFVSDKTVNEEVLLTFTVTATDAGNDPITLTDGGLPSGASYTDNGDGTGSFSWTPSSTQGGIVYTVIFNAQDSEGADATPESVDITVNDTVSANDPPVADDQSESTAEDTPVTFDLDVSDPNGDPLSCSLDSGPSHGSVTGIDDCLSVEYTPDPNYNGPDSFSYTASDGLLTDDATVSLTVNPINDAPIANVSQEETTAEDTPVTFDLDVVDVDGDILSCSVFVFPLHGLLTGVADCNNLEYTPDADYHGLDSFQYTVSDGLLTDDATVSLTVTPENDAPDAVDDIASTDEDTAVGIAVLSNDTDPDGDTLSVDSFTQGAHGAVVDMGTYLEYTPAADYHGPDSFDYTVTDGLLTDTATVYITVDPVNDAPVANDQSVDLNEDTTATFNLDVSDVDGDTLSCSVDTAPAHGLLSGVSGCLNVEYTPDANYNGSDSFTYTVSDGLLTDDATVSLTINPMNDDPSAVDDYYTMDEDDTLYILFADLVSNDIDIDGDALRVMGMSFPLHGNWVLDDVNSADANGVFYTPDPNYNGPDSFKYGIDDYHGVPLFEIYGFVNITITSINDAPVANDQNVATDEDTPVTFALDVSDVEGDALTCTLDTNALHGTVIVDLNCDATYTPDPNYNGADSFTYSVSDGNLLGSGTVSLTVNPVNDAPVLAPIGDQSVTEGDVLTFGISATDVDSNVLAFSATGLPLWATLTDNGDGTATISGTASGVGTTTATFTVADDANATDDENVAITVNELPPQETCGNGVCGTGEDCGNCATDCGSCVGGGSGGGGGGGGGGGPSKFCTILGGFKCSTEQVCDGSLIEAIDAEVCCNTECSSTSFAEEGGEEGEGGGPDLCLGIDCEDSNPCTRDSCSFGVCEFEKLSGTSCYTDKGRGVCVEGDCVVEEAAPGIDGTETTPGPTGFFGLGDAADAPIWGILLLFLGLLAYGGYKYGLKK